MQTASGSGQIASILGRYGMTEELEKKLNELLGLKTRLEAVAEENQRTLTAGLLNRYKKKNILISTWFGIRYVLGFALVASGFVFLARSHGVLNIDCPTIIIVGLLVMTIARIEFLIVRSRLAVLQEMKQFELRVTELLKQ